MSIHQHVNKGIGKDQNAVISTRVGHQEQTNNHCHAAMMVHMEESNLTIGLSENEQESVNKLPVFLHVVNIHKLNNKNHPLLREQSTLRPQYQNQHSGK